MKICCAGSYRSGSTWMFNVLRIIFPKDSLIKTHPPMLEDFDIVLTSHRDLRRIAASLWRKWGHLPNYGWTQVWNCLDEVVQWHSWWCKHDKIVMDMKYEDMVVDPKAMIERMLRVFSKSNDSKKILEEIEQISLPSEGYDAFTLMHWNHITSKDPMCIKPLTEEEALKIQTRFSVWQKKHGYN